MVLMLSFPKKFATNIVFPSDLQQRAVFWTGIDPSGATQAMHIGLFFSAQLVADVNYLSVGNILRLESQVPAHEECVCKWVGIYGRGFKVSAFGRS